MKLGIVAAVTLLAGIGFVAPILQGTTKGDTPSKAEMVQAFVDNAGTSTLNRILD